jgi:D-glycero-D-manno-heptose 1,7-bisphosphate phosphatase
MRNWALFLDRDGVINVDTGHTYKVEDIVFVEGITELICEAKSLGAKIIVVTNQSGIGRGIYSEDEFHSLMSWMNAELEKKGAAWDAYYFCPHDPTKADGGSEFSCECRKPMPGMILRAAKEQGVDLSRSVLIGDNESDILAAERAGVRDVVLAQNGMYGTKLVIDQASVPGLFSSNNRS